MYQTKMESYKMDLQAAFDIAILLIGGLGGWILNSMRDSISSLRNTDEELLNKVQHIEVLVAGNYIKRDEHDAKFDKLTDLIFRKLETIEDILNKKEDKRAY
jgi:hypothetical protein